MKYTRLDTYATPIWTYALDHLRPFQEAMIQAVVQQRAEQGSKPVEGSTHNGFHSTDGELLNRSSFEELRAALLRIAPHVLQDYGLNTADVVYSIYCWANVHDRGGYNASHVHPGAWISGSFYLKVPDGAGRIFFDDPRPAVRVEHFPRSEGPNEPVRARGRTYLQPKEMMLVLFPGWLEHGVEECRCEERISVAFNISPVQLRKTQLDVLMRAAEVR